MMAVVFVRDVDRFKLVFRVDDGEGVRGVCKDLPRALFFGEMEEKSAGPTLAAAKSWKT